MSNAPIDRIKRLRRRLYPTGRVFHMQPGSEFDKLESVATEQNAEVYNDAVSILDTILPDNPNFTPDDATRWEERLGLIVDPPGVSFDDRKAAIIRKMNHPGGILARQSWDYVQDSLQTAGFDLYVHENVNELTIQQVLALNTAFNNFGQFNFGQSNFGDVESYFSQYFSCINYGVANFGQFNWGQKFFNQKVMNFIDPELDTYYPVLSWRDVFYVGGPNLGDIANVPEARRTELRQLLLKLKPVQTIAFLTINYT